MEETIELLRDRLNKLVKESESLCSEEILEISQRLDKLLYKYYLNESCCKAGIQHCNGITKMGIPSERC